MTAFTIHQLENGWAGDRRRQKLVVTVANGYTLSPAACGLKTIEAIRPTHRIGTWDYGNNDLASVSHVEYTGSSGVAKFWQGANADAQLTSGKAEIFVYGT